MKQQAWCNSIFWLGTVFPSINILGVCTGNWSFKSTAHLDVVMIFFLSFFQKTIKGENRNPNTEKGFPLNSVSLITNVLWNGWETLEMAEIQTRNFPTRSEWCSDQSYLTKYSVFSSGNFNMKFCFQMVDLSFDHEICVKKWNSSDLVLSRH